MKVERNVISYKKPGSSMKTIKIEPKKINLKKFKHFAIYISSDIQEIIVCKALIEEPKEVKCHGVIPTKGGGFNCCIGDYKEKRCDILIYREKTDIPIDMFDMMRYYFGANYIYTDKKYVYSTTMGADCIDNFLEKRGNREGYYGYFYNMEHAKECILKLKDSYTEKLQKKFKEEYDNIITTETIDKAFDNNEQLNQRIINGILSGSVRKSKEDEQDQLIY